VAFVGAEKFSEFSLHYITLNFLHDHILQQADFMMTGHICSFHIFKHVNLEKVNCLQLLNLK